MERELKDGSSDITRQLWAVFQEKLMGALQEKGFYHVEEEN